MNAPDARTHHLIVFAVWIVIGIGATCFFFGSKNAKLKRRVFPWFVIGAGATFVVYVILTTDRSPFELLFFPVIGLITFLNIRMTKFCDSCGAMIFNQTWFWKMRYCSRCGAALDKSDTEQDEDPLE